MPEQITIEQRRAEAAWDTLTREDHFGTDLEKLNADGSIAKPDLKANVKFAKQYLNAMRQTATRVHVSGLGQAIAFLRARKDEAPKAAANDLAYLTLRAMEQTNVVLNENTSLELIHLVQNGDLIKMMRATEEVMGLIAWFTRYLQGAGIEAGDDTDDDDDENAATEGPEEGE